METAPPSNGPDNQLAQLAAEEKKLLEQQKNELSRAFWRTAPMMERPETGSAEGTVWGDPGCGYTAASGTQ